MEEKIITCLTCKGDGVVYHITDVCGGESCGSRDIDKRSFNKLQEEYRKEKWNPAQYYVFDNTPRKCSMCSGSGKAIGKGAWSPFNYRPYSSSGCFITTATLKSLNTQDNGPELTAFREFRDTWLGEYNPKLITEYYQIAPQIVKSINTQPNAQSIYENIWNKYLSKCLSYIYSKQYEKAKDLYIRLVRILEKEFIIN
jgi:hypothetical protein